MQIRQAQPADLSELADVYVESFGSATEPWTHKAAFELLAHFMEGFGHEICSVAIINDKPVGGFFAKFRPWFDGLRVTEIEFFVSKKYQNGIVGAGLAVCALERARAIGAVSLEGLVYSEEIPLLAMYAKGRVQQDTSLTIVSGKIDDVLEKMRSPRMNNLLMNYTVGGEIINGIGSDSFYGLMHNSIAEVKSGNHIWAVSGMMESEWSDDILENAFFADNMAAVARGADLTRVFIYTDKDIEKFKTNDKLRALISDLRIKTMFVHRELAAQKIPAVLNALTYGMFGVDENFLMGDMPYNGHARGYATFDQMEIKKFRGMFDELMSIASPEITDAR